MLDEDYFVLTLIPIWKILNQRSFQIVCFTLSSYKNTVHYIRLQAMHVTCPIELNHKVNKQQLFIHWIIVYKAKLLV